MWKPNAFSSLRVVGAGWGGQQPPFQPRMGAVAIAEGFVAVAAADVMLVVIPAGFTVIGHNVLLPYTPFGVFLEQYTPNGVYCQEGGDFLKKYKRLRDLREDKDLTQTKLAEMLYIHKTTYVRYESGERELPFNVAIQLADFYDVSLDYLAGRSNNPTRLD